MDNVKKISLHKIAQFLNEVYEKNPAFSLLTAFLVILFAVLFSSGNSESVDSASLEKRLDSFAVDSASLEKRLNSFAVDSASLEKRLNSFAVDSASLEKRLDSSEVEAGLKLFDAALNDGDYNLAEIYLVNAIQREPSNMETIAMFEKLAHSNPAFDLVALDRASALIESLMFKVSPEDVPSLGSLIAKLSEQVSVTVATTNTTGVEVGEGSNLLKLGPNSPIDSQSIAIYIEQLDQFLENANGAEPQIRREVEKSRNSWLFASQIHNSISFVESCLANVESLSKSDMLDSQAAVSTVQAGENAMAAFWSVPFDKLPVLYQTKVTEYPDQIQRKVDEIAIARSQKSMQLIESFEKTARDQLKALKIETRCKALKTAIREIQQEAAAIPSQSVRNDVKTKLDSLANELQDQRRIQFDKYQEFTLGKCVRLVNDFQDETVVSVADANYLFNKHTLDQIDQTMLSPEVSQCFNSILQKLFAELKAKDIVTLQKRLGDSRRKTKLEDF